MQAKLSIVPENFGRGASVNNGQRFAKFKGFYTLLMILITCTIINTFKYIVYIQLLNTD